MTLLQVDEGPTQVWGEGERPSWLVPDDLQPKKREWSPARDRMEAELELRARLLEQKHLRRRGRLRFLLLPFIWIVSLFQAVVDVGRNRPDIVEPRRAEAAPHNAAASLDALPAVRPTAPAEDTASSPSHGWAPLPTEQIAPVPYEVPQPPAAVSPPEVAEHPDVAWPDAVEPAPPPPAPGPQAPPRDWRPTAQAPSSEAVPEAPPAAAPPAHWPGEGPEEEAPSEPERTESLPPQPALPPPLQPQPTVALPPQSLPPPPTVALPPQPPQSLPPQPTVALPPQPTLPPPPRPLPPQPTERLGAGDMLGVILGTCRRSSGAEVGVVLLLQDDVLIVRATSGIDPDTAARVALETLGDVCLDVVAGANPVRAYDASPRIPDPHQPRAILCVPILIAGAGAGAVLLAAYAPGREFTAEHERLVADVAKNAGPALAKAGAFQLPLDRPGDRWRRLDQVGSAVVPVAPQATPEPPITEHGTGEITGSPMSTMTLDPESMRRVIAQAKAARAAEEAAAAAEQPPPPVPVPPAATADRVAEWEEPAGGTEAEPATEGEAAALSLQPEPAEPAPKRPGWRDRVTSRMTRVAEQREHDRARYRLEILAAVRNLSWDGYQALIADIYRRKAFEVFPPPVSGTDLDVIDLVVDRDGKRMLINCQLRGEMDIPAAAVTEMGNVVYNYSVSGAYLIADGSFAADAIEAAPATGVVLIDGEALIDLVIETTLKDESKPSGLSRFAKRFARAS